MREKAYEEEVEELVVVDCLDHTIGLVSRHDPVTQEEEYEVCKIEADLPYHVA